MADTSDRHVVPYLRVEAWPLGAVPRCYGRGWSLTDTIQNMLRGPGLPDIGMSPDSAAPPGLTLAPAAGSAQGGTLKNITNMQYRELPDEVGGTNVSGFIVRPQWVPRNSYVDTGNGPDNVAAPSERYRAVGWLPDAADGGDYWRTCRADENDHTGLTWHSSDPTARFGARTNRILPKAQPFAVRLRTWGPVPHRTTTDSPYVQLSWGGEQYAVQVRPKSAPVLLQTNSATRDAVGTTPTVLREFAQDARGGFFEGEETWVYVEHLAGRMVATVQGPGGSYQQVLTQAGEPGRLSKQLDETRSGPLQLQGRGCTAVAEVYEGRHASYDPGVPGDPASARWDRGAGFEREYQAPISPIAGRGTMSADNGSGYFGLKVLALGYPAYGKKNYQVGNGLPAKLPLEIAAMTDVDAADPKARNKRRYAVATKSDHAYSPAGGPTTSNTDPSPNTNAPAPVSVTDDESSPWNRVHHNTWWRSSTPLIHAVSVSYRSKFTAPLEVGPIDLRPALESASSETCDPTVQPTRRFEAKVRHSMLPQCPVIATGLPVGELWPYFVGKHKRVKVYAAWMDAAGQKTAYWPVTNTDEGEILVFDGMQTAWSPNVPGYGKGVAGLHAQDDSVRLAKPWGLIDERFAPLDVLLAQKMRAAPARTAGYDKLYGWEAIQYILQQITGKANIRYYIPAGRPSLIEYLALTEPPSGSGFIFPPPFGEDALTWIRRIADADFAVFFFDQFKVGGAWSFVPHYGNYYCWIANAPSYNLYDWVPGALDWTNPLAGLGINERAELDINRFLVWGRHPQEGGRNELMPALPAFSAEAGIYKSTILGQNIQDTDERTWVGQGTSYWLPGVAARVVNELAGWITDLRLRGATLKGRGLPGMSWGHNVTVNPTAGPFSDPIPEFAGTGAGTRWRTARVKHEWTFGQETNYTTTADCMPRKDPPANYTGALTPGTDPPYCLENGQPV